MNKEFWTKLAVGVCSVASTIAIYWLCSISGTVVAHGQSITALETRCEALKQSDEQQRAMLTEIRADIKLLLTRGAAGSGS